jgi:hypothetical protein
MSQCIVPALLLVGSLTGCGLGETASTAATAGSAAAKSAQGGKQAIDRASTSVQDAEAVAAKQRQAAEEAATK